MGNYIAQQKRSVKILKARVKKGIKWLDKEVGRKAWLKRVSLKKLDLSNSYTCVCGQVFGDFMTGLFRANKNPENASSIKTIKLGFYLDYSEKEKHSYGTLQYIWYKEISKLKKRLKK